MLAQFAQATIDSILMVAERWKGCVESFVLALGTQGQQVKAVCCEIADVLAYVRKIDFKDFNNVS